MLSEDKKVQLTLQNCESGTHVGVTMWLNSDKTEYKVLDELELLGPDLQTFMVDKGEYVIVHYNPGYSLPDKHGNMILFPEKILDAVTVSVKEPTAVSFGCR